MTERTVLMSARSAGTCTPRPRTCQRVSSLRLCVAGNCNSHPCLDMTMSPCNEGESCKDEYCLYRHPKKAQRAYRFDYLACYHDGRIVAAYKGPSGTLFKQVRYRHYPLRENIQHESRYLADINQRLDYVIRRMQQLGEGRRLEETGTPLSPANPATLTSHSTAPPPIHYPLVPNVMAQPFDLARHPPVLRGPTIAPHGGHRYPMPRCKWSYLLLLHRPCSRHPDFLRRSFTARSDTTRPLRRHRRLSTTIVVLGPYTFRLY
jgi:hypothetical protein